MWEPIGPLPAAVYWRRRWLAVVAAVVAVLLLMWCANAIGAARADDDPPDPAAAGRSLTAPQQISPSPATPTAPVPADPAQPAPAQTAAGPASAEPRPAPDAAVPPVPAGPAASETTPARPTAVRPTGPSTAQFLGPPTPSRSGTAGSPASAAEQLRPGDVPSVPTPAPVAPSPPPAPLPPAPVPPPGPVQCTNAVLEVTAEIDRIEHRVGERPVLRLVVINAGGQPCVRDLDAARQEIVVWSGDGESRLWSSNDCTNPSTVDLRTLVPGEALVFPVTWAGRTSTPGCAQPRTEVPAGGYRVRSRVDDDVSPPTPFLRSR